MDLDKLYCERHETLDRLFAARDWAELGRAMPAYVTETVARWLAELGVKRADRMVEPAMASWLYTVDSYTDPDFLRDRVNRGGASWVANAARACLAAQQPDLAAVMAEVEPMFAATQGEAELLDWLHQELCEAIETEYERDCRAACAA